jgi:hypothetical protein
MADKGRLSIEQRIKTVLFFSETRSAVVTQRRFRVHFQTQWAPSFKTIYKLYNQFNKEGSLLERKRRRPWSVRFPENVDAVRVALRKASVDQQGRLQHNLGCPGEPWYWYQCFVCQPVVVNCLWEFPWITFLIVFCVRCCGLFCVNIVQLQHTRSGFSLV